MNIDFVEPAAQPVLLGVKKHMAKKQSLEQKKLIRAQSQKRKEEQIKQENAILNRCIGLLGILVIAEIYFLICYRFFVQGTMQSLVTMSTVITVVGYLGLAVAAVGVILAVIRRKKGSIHLGVWMVILGVVLFGGSRVMLAVYPAGTTVMCVVVPLLALAGFVYYLYQREFFCAGLGLGLSVGGLWLAHRAVGSANWGTRYLVVEAILLVAVIALLVFSILVGRSGGKLGKGEKARAVFSGTSNYAVAYGALILAAIGILAAAFAPAAAFYLMWAGIALLFILAVYYTIHLM